MWSNVRIDVVDDERCKRAGAVLRQGRSEPMPTWAASSTRRLRQTHHSAAGKPILHPQHTRDLQRLFEYPHLIACGRDLDASMQGRAGLTDDGVPR